MYELTIGFITERFNDLGKCIAEIDWLKERGIIPEFRVILEEKC